MPQGPPAVCGEFYHDLNTWDALDKHRKSHRFLNALGVPNEHDVKYGLNSITHNGETIQYVEMSKGDKDQKDLLLCAQDDTTDDGRLLEYCNKRNDNHGSHYIHRGKPWPVALPAKDPPCLDDIPRDSALGGIPVVQLGVDGCPLLRDGQMIPLNLRIGGYRNWDWRAGHFIH